MLLECDFCHFEYQDIIKLPFVNGICDEHDIFFIGPDSYQNICSGCLYLYDFKKGKWK